MARIDTVVIGTSAGGVEALTRLIPLLTADLPVAVFVVLHFPQSSTSVLPVILSRSGQLPAKHPKDGEVIHPGWIYVAPPGQHMLVSDGHVRLVRGPKENGHRPAIDPLFRTAAHSRGPRVVSVVLTGLLDDGTLGTSAVKSYGGTTIAQDPEEALFGNMPRHAIEQVGVDYVLPLHAIADKIVELAGRPVVDQEENVLDPTEMSLRQLQEMERQGKPSEYVCPECHGTLYEINEEGVMHYRCRVGHSYLSESLASDQAEVLEMALWSALRSVKEHNSLLKQMADRAETRGMRISARNYFDKLEEGMHRAALIERALNLTHVPDEREVPTTSGVDEIS